MFDIAAGGRKTVVGMVHLGALPGTPLYDADRGMAGLIDDAAADLRALQAGGIDAVMFGNENDRPYSLKAPQASVAAMSAIVAALRGELRVPFGVNYLWDPVASVAIAVATGAAFVREIFTGVYASDMGLWVPDAEGAARARRQLDRRDLKFLFNINAEFAAPLDTRPIALRARSAVFSSLADAILVSGPITGQAVDESALAQVREAVPAVPVLANTGVTIDNVAAILKLADGCIVGTHLKVDGVTWNKVDGERVKRFMDHVGRLR
ncbi:MAG: BtpA/SgcQ family protein [Alphaproteobacteria bacterium]